VFRCSLLLALALLAPALGAGAQELRRVGLEVTVTHVSQTPGAIDPVHGKIDTVLFQYVFSFGQLFYHPAPFWGQGPDLIASVFGMYNHVDRPLNTAQRYLDKLKFGAD
jgi:hypothetical protein